MTAEKPYSACRRRRFEVVAGHQHRAGDRLDERRQLGDDDGDPQSGRPRRAGQRWAASAHSAGAGVGDDQQPRHRRGASRAWRWRSASADERVGLVAGARPARDRPASTSTTVTEVLSRRRMTTRSSPRHAPMHGVDGDEVRRRRRCRSASAATSATTASRYADVARRRASVHVPAIASRSHVDAVAHRHARPATGSRRPAARRSASTPHRTASGAAVSRHRRSGLVTRSGSATGRAGRAARPPPRPASSPTLVEAGIGVAVPARRRPARGARGGPAPSAGALQQPAVAQPGARARLDEPLGAEDPGEDLLGHGEEHADVGHLAGVGRRAPRRFWSTVRLHVDGEVDLGLRRAERVAVVGRTVGVEVLAAGARSPPSRPCRRAASRLNVASNRFGVPAEVGGAVADAVDLDVVGVAVAAVPVVDARRRRPAPRAGPRPAARRPRRRRPARTTPGSSFCVPSGHPGVAVAEPDDAVRRRGSRPTRSVSARRRSTSVSPSARSSGASPCSPFGAHDEHDPVALGGGSGHRARRRCASSSGWAWTNTIVRHRPSGRAVRRTASAVGDGAALDERVDAVLGDAPVGEHLAGVLAGVRPAGGRPRGRCG